jgi:ABC-type phosphate/phosphonate transport system substrate-binding protein
MRELAPLSSRLLILPTVGVIMALAQCGVASSGKTKPLQIGMAKTFFTDQTKDLVDITADDFKEVMKKTTGLNGELVFDFTAPQVAEKLDSKELDFGIFHGHEFAWVQKKYPDLLPLLIAANKYHEERAYLVVHKNSPAKTVADLRSKKLAMPSATKEHCRVFIEKQCGKPGAFFGSIEKSASQEAALDDVARGKVEAAIIDKSSLEFYKEIKEPVYAKHLKILVESEPFPPAVIVYKKGALDEATLNQFRDGLLKAHTIFLGREMMKTWKIEAFEPMPKDYARRLADVLKRYPAPVAQP